LLPSVFEPSRYAEVEDFDTWLAEVRERLARRAEEDGDPTAGGKGAERTGGDAAS
jgi:hypothetical protein